jgi:hypothetical protein
VTGYLKKLKEFLNSLAGKKAEEEDGIGFSRMCVCVQRCDWVPEEAEGVPELPGWEEGEGGGWNRLLKDVCLCRGVTGYLKKLKEFLNSPAGKKAEEEDGIGYSRMCVSVQRRDGVPEEAEGVPQLPGGEEGGGGGRYSRMSVCVQRCDRVPEEAEGVPQLPCGEEGGGGGWNRFLKDVCVCAEV